MPVPGPIHAIPPHGTDRQPPSGRRRAARDETPGATSVAHLRVAPIGSSAPSRASYDLTWEMAIELFEQAGSDSVRAIEALAAALTNRLRDHLAAAPAHKSEDRATRSRPDPGSEGCRSRPVPVAATLSPEAELRFQICQRIARRSLGGSLPDPTGGATAFHRIGEHPAWAGGLLPVAEIGPFLFYRLG